MYNNVIHLKFHHASQSIDAHMNEKPFNKLLRVVIVCSTGHTYQFMEHRRTQLCTKFNYFNKVTK